MNSTTNAASNQQLEMDRYRKQNPYRVDWYARDRTIRQTWFRTLREAREEAKKHKDAEIWREFR